MNVTHDIIAAVVGPGWKYGLSRILINEDNEGVVFVAGSEEPFAFFTVDSVSTGKGKGHNDEGDISWRRRGSSCQYKLAKCKVDTATITGWWTDSLEGQGESTSDEMDVPTGSAAEVMAWVGDDMDRAKAALDAENAGKQRVGLTNDLENMLAEDVL